MNVLHKFKKLTTEKFLIITIFIAKFKYFYYLGYSKIIHEN